MNKIKENKAVIEEAELKKKYKEFEEEALPHMNALCIENDRGSRPGR